MKIVGRRRPTGSQVTHLQHDICLLKNGLTIVDQDGTFVFVVCVGESGLLPGTFLDDDAKSQFFQSRYSCRHDGDAPFLRIGFACDSCRETGRLV